jgi:plastocyanin
VDIQNFAFDPPVIIVKKGTTVRWENEDEAPHTVTGDTAGGPNSPLLQEDDEYEFTFNTVGSFPYHCTPHPHMRGTVIVTN